MAMTPDFKISSLVDVSMVWFKRLTTKLGSTKITEVQIRDYFLKIDVLGQQEIEKVFMESVVL